MFHCQRQKEKYVYLYISSVTNVPIGKNSIFTNEVKGLQDITLKSKQGIYGYLNSSLTCGARDLYKCIILSPTTDLFKSSCAKNTAVVEFVFHRLHRVFHFYERWTKFKSKTRCSTRFLEIYYIVFSGKTALINKILTFINYLLNYIAGSL